MSDGIVSTAERMKAAFDRGFEEPVQDGAEQRLDFVLVVAGKKQVALPVGDLRSIEYGSELVEVPSRVEALLGLSAVRGVVVPVFSLGTLLGGAVMVSEGWKGAPVFAMVEGEEGERLGLGFEKLLQFVRVEAGAVFGGTTVMHEGEMFEVVGVRAVVGRVVGA